MILVTGGNGVLGKALREFLPDAIYLSRDELDVTDELNVIGKIIKFSPDIVIHAAAITDHQCPDTKLLKATNVDGTEHVASAVRQVRPCRLVYLSTHYVYPGETGNYKETDDLRAIGLYAASKAIGELRSKATRDWLIIRGSWYTPEKLKSWKGAVSDAYCSREPVRSAAEKIARLVQFGVTGIYNIGGPRRSFAKIAADEGVDTPIITRADLKLPYPFPADSSVNTDRYDAL